MSEKVRSAKGEMVDFDLIRIKNQISTPPSALVQEREKIIDRKLKRKIKKVDAPIPKIKKEAKPTEVLVHADPALIQEEKSNKRQKIKHIENITEETPDDFETNQ